MPVPEDDCKDSGVSLRRSPAPRPPAFDQAALQDAASEGDCDDRDIVLRRGSQPRSLAFDQAALDEAAIALQKGNSDSGVFLHLGLKSRQPAFDQAVLHYTGQRGAWHA